MRGAVLISDCGTYGGTEHRHRESLAFGLDHVLCHRFGEDVRVGVLPDDSKTNRYSVLWYSTAWYSHRRDLVEFLVVQSLQQ
jgi:hypothetical protein